MTGELTVNAERAWEKKNRACHWSTKKKLYNYETVLGFTVSYSLILDLISPQLCANVLIQSLVVDRLSHHLDSVS